MMAQILATLILPLGGIIFIDLILSSDNALVIGTAIIGIPPRWRTLALVLGGIVAILLRILFTIFATFLLRFDYLQTIGGLLVLWVTWRLLVEPRQKEPSEESVTHRVGRLPRTGQLIAAHARQPGQDRLLIAVLTIVITDLTMSVDNVIAVAALAHGQLITLSIGLILSIIILLIGSALVARLVEHHPKLIILSGFMLAWIAGNMIVQDTSNYLPFVSQYMPYTSISIYLLAFSFVVLAIMVRRKRTRRSPPREDGDLSDSHFHTQSDSVTTYKLHLAS